MAGYFPWRRQQCSQWERPDSGPAGSAPGHDVGLISLLKLPRLSSLPSSRNCAVSSGRDWCVAACGAALARGMVSGHAVCTPAGWLIQVLSLILRNYILGFSKASPRPRCVESKYLSVRTSRGVLRRAPGCVDSSVTWYEHQPRITGTLEWRRSWCPRSPSGPDAMLTAPQELPGEECTLGSACS